MTLRTILFIAPHLWMKSGWMKKVVDKVEMSYVVNVLEMMLEFVLETNPRGRKCQLRLVPPPLLLFLEVMALSFPIPRMILRSSLGPQNQREVLVLITTPTMMMTVFLPQFKFLRELHQLHHILMLDLVGLHVRRNLLIGLFLGQITFETLVPIMFGSRVRMVGWRDLISGHFDEV
jgi:hypothetical protein